MSGIEDKSYCELCDDELTESNISSEDVVCNDCMPLFVKNLNKE